MSNAYPFSFTVPLNGLKRKKRNLKKRETCAVMGENRVNDGCSHRAPTDRPGQVGGSKVRVDGWGLYGGTGSVISLFKWGIRIWKNKCWKKNTLTYYDDVSWVLYLFFLHPLLLLGNIIKKWYWFNPNRHGPPQPQTPLSCPSNPIKGVERAKWFSGLWSVVEKEMRLLVVFACLVGLAAALPPKSPKSKKG